MTGLEVAVGGVVTVAVVGHEDASPPVRRWVESALGSLPAASTEGEPDVVLAFEEHIPPPSAHLQHGLALAGDAVWVGDRLGRGALVPVLEPGTPVRVDRRIAPMVLRDEIYAYVVRRALRDHGALVTPLTAVEIAGRRVGITGWSGHGKTQLALALLGHGARLIGDDLVALLPGGGVGSVLMDVTFRPEHLPLLPGAPRRAGSRRRLVAVLERVARSSGSPTITKLADGLAEVARVGAEALTSPGQLGFSPEPGRPGPLDLVVVLGASDDAAALVTASERLYFLGHDAVDAVVRGRWPRTGWESTPGLTGGDTLSTWLSGVPVLNVPSSATIAQLREAVGRIDALLDGVVTGRPRGTARP